MKKNVAMVSLSAGAVVAISILLAIATGALNSNRSALDRHAGSFPNAGFRSAIIPSEDPLIAPPMEAVNWPGSYSTLATSDTWSTIDFIYPKQVIRVGQAYVLLMQTRHVVDGAKVMTTSLASADDITGPWVESPMSPIFDQVEHAWQGNRAMGEQLVYDKENKRWALIFCGNGGKRVPGQGIRAIGIAFSQDLEDWTIHPDPIVCVETADILDWAPGDPVERLYCHGLVHAHGWWYMIVNAGGQGRYKTGVLKSRDLPGRWEGIAANPVLEGTTGAWDEAAVNLMSPVYVNGRWWAVYNSLPDEPGRRTLGLAWTDSLESKWSKSESFLHRYGDGPEAAMDRPVLVPFPDGWAVLAGKRIPEGKRGELRLIMAREGSDALEK
jgi:hypothetical protein